MNILITNDDGIHSESLLPLKEALGQIGKVTIIVPDRERSASAHSITLHKPLRVKEVRLPDSSKALITNGTPSDCVVLGVLEIMERAPDLVVSGINRGPNLAEDMTYSGTVCAAMEGALLGINSFSLSVTSYEAQDFAFAAKFGEALAKILVRNPLPKNVFLNVNIPDLPEEQIKGIEVTRQGKGKYQGVVNKGVDPKGRPYYWLAGEFDPGELEEGTDLKAIAEGKISITPVKLDLTAYELVPELKNMLGGILKCP